MNHITMLAQSLDASNPGNFFFALPISGVEHTPLGDKVIPCPNNRAVGYRCWGLDSNVTRSDPPMGSNIWETYGQIVMFPRGTKEMSIISIKSFMEINPEFNAMEVLTRTMPRDDLAAVLEMKLGMRGGMAAARDPHVANEGMRDITSKSTVVSRKKR